jgi:peptidoglycan/LPS O-acetylase OafA/YrhL
MFFLLSGFLASVNNANKQKWNGAPDYLMRKASRLYPTLWAYESPLFHASHAKIVTK